MAEGTMLPAGRELDALVAEKVMGATWRAEDGIRPGYHWLRAVGDRRTAWGAPEILASRDAAGQVDVHHGCPAYSTDIAAAWTVLEKLRADGTIDMASVSVGEHGWWCVLYPPLGHGQLSVESDYCDTAAEAICRAALATLPPAGAR